MKSRLESLPKYQTDHTHIDANVYNRIRLGLLRNGHSLRFPIPGLKNLEAIIEDDYWACVDASLNDIPVFAWTDFQIKNRTSLHLPIHCKLYSYHAHTDLIKDRVMEEIVHKFDQLLATIESVEANSGNL